MWEYYALLRLRTKLPVFPLAIYLPGGEGGLVEGTYTESVLGMTPLLFRCKAVRLPDLSADDWRERDNPLAPFLAPVMKTSKTGRVAQKFEALVRIARTRTDDARKSLLVNVVERFIVFQSATEQADFQRRLAEVSPDAEIKKMISVYEERGIQIGFEQGIAQGLSRGQQHSRLRILTAKFGAAPGSRQVG